MVQLHETDSPPIDERLDFFEHIEEHFEAWPCAYDERQILELRLDVGRDELNTYVRHFHGYSITHPVKREGPHEVTVLAQFDEAFLDGENPFIVVSPVVGRRMTGRSIPVSQITLARVGVYQNPRAPHFDLRAGQ